MREAWNYGNKSQKLLPVDLTFVFGHFAFSPFGCLNKAFDNFISCSHPAARKSGLLSAIWV